MKPNFIVGASGQVAGALLRALEGQRILLSSRNFAPELVQQDGRSLIQLDLEKPETIRHAFSAWSKENSGTAGNVYLTGAWTAVDQCEKNPARSKLINVDGVLAVAEECRKYGHHLLFYSTEYVFGGAEYEGGAKGPFAETATPYPISVYGQHKLDAEQKLAAILPSALIIRTTMVFSYDPQGLNFAMQVYRTLRAPAPATKVKVPYDQISTPTYAPSLAEASVQLMSQNASGIFNIAGKDLVSRPEFIKRLADCYGLSQSLIEQRYSFVSTQEINAPAKRPLTAGLLTEKAVAKGIKVLSLGESLAALQKLIS